MRSIDFLFEYYRQLDEIAMRPGRLRQLAADIGAMVGMEFEMVVPKVSGIDDDEGESEPDYGADERIRRFRDIREFFHDGNFNGRREVERLADTIWSDYTDSDWLSERKQEEWSNVAEDHIRDLVERDYGDDYQEQAEQEAKAAAPEFGMNAEELQQDVDARYKKLFLDKVEDIMANMGDEYDAAYEEWEDQEWSEMWNDDDMFTDWAESEGMRTMAHIASAYEITWPHWTTPESDNEVDVEYIANDFSEAIGRPVNWSNNYHGAKRTAKGYVVEPDSSIRGNDGEGGLEFVSPPLPIDEMISDLDKVKKWAKENGAYTNESTGLHINVSVPDWGGNLQDLDYVKLALLLGDEYVLDQFGRTGNTYAQSAFEIVKRHIRQRPQDAEELLSKMKSQLNAAASKLIHSGVTQKYTSVNVKDGYIEFRSPGGDWLNDNFDKIESTLLRFVVAMDAAVNPDKYKEEYAKKLYKLLAPSNDSADTLQYFAQFSAGTLPRSALASFVKQAQLQRTIKKAGPQPGKKYWWDVSKSDSYAGIRVVAATQDEAIRIAQREYPEWQYARNIVATPTGEYNQPETTARSSRDDANYEIVDRSNNRSVFRFIANTDQEAQRKYVDWLAGRGLPADTENYGWRALGQ